jgi:hypothetical protein
MNTIVFPLFVHRARQIFAGLTDFDVSLINAVRSSGEFQMRADSSIDLGRVSLDPSEDRGMI